MKKVKITTEFIKLDQFLKWIGIASSGLEAKNLILDGEVKVNGETELKRGRKIYPDYIVEIFEEKYIIE